MATGYDETKEDKSEPKEDRFEKGKEKGKQDFARKMQKDDASSKSTEEQILEMEKISTDVRITSTSTEDLIPSKNQLKKYKEEEQRINSKNIALWDKTTQEMGIEAKKILLSSYPDAGSIRYKGIELGVIKDKTKRGFGRVGMRLEGSDEDFVPIRNKDGSFRKRIGKRLEENLGPNMDEADNQIKVAIDKVNEDKIFQESIRDDPKSSKEERNIAIENLRNIKIEEEKLRERENYLSKNKSLGERIKTFFKTKGMAIAIVLSTTAVITEIILNLTSGAKSGLKAVKNGLKDLGKKLASLLPGMVGAIVSFIFSKASEVVGFLAKNTWLLILAVVIYFIEQFKNKKK